MRTPVKYRLLFLLIAISCYSLGFNFIPASTENKLGLLPVIIASCGYFLLLPLLYWFLVIKAGKQRAWKIIIIFSLSSAMARFSFPTDIAQYFEFIMWLRYPLIAVLLVIELVLMVTIIKGLWQARNLSGDPRLSALAQHQDEKKQSMALTFATEPASWYYAISYLSRKHCQAITQLKLHSASRLHWFGVSFALIAAATLSYNLLADWSETVAIIVATIVLYSFILLTANHRLCRHYSVYLADEKLILNNSIFGLMVIELSNISSITQKISLKSEHKEQLFLGSAQQANIEICCHKPVIYWGMMGAMPESFEQVFITVDQPEKLTELLSEINCPSLQVA